MRVTAFTRYGARAASTRQRLLQFIPHFRAAGIEIEHHALLDDEYVASLVTEKRYPRHKIAWSYGKRVKQLVGGTQSDLVWVYVDLFPYLPGRILLGSRRVL